MSAIGRQYAKQMIKSNYRLLILVVIIQILILQNQVFPFNFMMNQVIGGDISGTQFSLAAFSICICIMAFSIPIYQFRYLMKKDSSDLYLSLPIKRQELFHIQFILGAMVLVLTTMLSLFCANITSLYMITSFSYMLKILLLQGLGLVLYALFTWVIIKCYTLLDGILMNIAYTVFPLLIMITIYEFLVRVVGSILISNIYGMGDVMGSDMFFLITCFMSVPVTMLVLVENTLFSIVNNNVILFVLLVHWFVLGINFYRYAKKSYCIRKGEQSGERTKTWATYPIMIPLFTICLLFIVGTTLNKLLLLIFITLGYILMYVFAQRKLKITIFMVVQFLCLFCIANGVERLLTWNHVFHTVQETFVLDDVYSNIVDLSFVSPSEEVGQEPSHNKTYTSENWSSLSIEEKQAFLNFHKEILTYCEASKSCSIDAYDRNTKFVYVTFSYQIDKQTSRNRGYAILDKQGLDIIERYKQEFIKMGILIEKNTEYAN